MRTGAKARLFRQASSARWSARLLVEAAVETSDPPAIELAVMADLALAHLLDRAVELYEEDEEEEAA